MMKVLDISQVLEPGIAVWPGDTPFEPFFVERMNKEGTCNVGSVRMSLHTGTHVDGPRHFARFGAAIGEMPPEVFIGPALVVEVAGAETIGPEHLAAVLMRGPTRVLFNTQRSVTAQPARGQTGLGHEAASLLADRGVRLVGIDTSSIDPPDSGDFATHRTLCERGVAILENLDLRDVEPGEYELIALPLRLAGMDASPVRAVLVRS